ncbi:MAG: alpha-amylase, partial [Bacteroidetes bacterium HGW-Bacteroidetes-9]
ISNDDPDVVKGRAGSPYAVKDYYNVNPDLAVDPANRLNEFKALIDRTHKHGMKVIIDIVPNHVARGYHSVSNPEGKEDFGASDDTSVEYARNNNFYYIPGQAFKVPDPLDGYKPLGGEAHPLADGKFDENPAKWTGNGSRQAQPHFHDWYETVKINFGIRPDGSKDFDTLPEGYENRAYADHYAFWEGKDVPDSWKKFRDIALYWIEMGVDGFRFDMAEMVPVEFWSYLNSSIKTANHDAFILAEVYNPSLYRDYIRKGKMDYLYDKVELYDTLKNIIQGHGSADHLVAIFQGQSDIEHHLLHFLENHDEQRIASPAFAGNAEKAKPAMVLSATISTSPTMIYFGQDVGEAGEGNPGFGSATRTTIFDYWGVPAHQRWMNKGAFDGGQLTIKEKALHEFYKNLFNFTIQSKALTGKYQELHSYNRANTSGYYDKSFSYARWTDDEHLLVVVNFKDWVADEFELKLP